jgi:hypothetical protein
MVKNGQMANWSKGQMVKTLQGHNLCTSRRRRPLIVRSLATTTVLPAADRDYPDIFPH